MYNNILCAVDTSAESKKILKKAKELAQQHGANLSLVHAIEYGFLPKDYQKKLKEEVAPLMAKLAAENEIPKKRCFVKFGQSYIMISELAEKLKCDLIVVGSHGKNGLRALLGSTANGVLQHAKCDVLLFKMN